MKEWFAPQKNLMMVRTPTKIREFYKRAQKLRWNTEEIDLTVDMNDWQDRLKDEERFFVKMVIAFFANSDSIVNAALTTRFMAEITDTQILGFYGEQVAQENVHSDTYALILETYVQDSAELEDMKNAITTKTCIRSKAEWAQRWINDKDATFGQRLVANACVEGIFFSGSFCAIFWLKKRGLMKALGHSNELISRDEGEHCRFACLLLSMLDASMRPSDEEILAIVTEAVAIEHVFVGDSLPVELIGMNSELMRQYISFCADHLLVEMGLPRHYKATNPFEWMELISVDGKTNFFEQRVSEYTSATTCSRVFTTTEDF